jgi:prepilin-type N-terminal cleavage/methylation domain-containing protein
MVKTRRSGFTLLEVIIVMFLAALIAAMGAPRLSAALRKRTTSVAADQFTAAHSLAKATAVRYGRVAQLHLDAAAKRIWVDADTSANGIGQRATIWYVRDLSAAGLTMSSTRSLLCFDARGIASTAGSCEAGDATVIFSESDKADTVTTTALGKLLR